MAGISPGQRRTHGQRVARDADALEAAFVALIDANPEHFAAQAIRYGSMAQVKRSLHVLIRREQEGDTSVTATLDQFEALMKSGGTC